MTTLEHPLPAGMRDLLPEEARNRRRLAKTVLARFSLSGYALVTPPVFEFADVLERGLGTLDPADVLRFVEPESGEVAALRPDMTPQIARIIATRLRDRPPPHRLAYEGSVLRRRSGRARKHRQIPQVGVELAGVAGLAGDLEILELAARALEASGLAYQLDVGDAAVVRALLADASSDVIAEIMPALAAKDEAAVTSTGKPLAHGAALARLTCVQGGREALDEGAKLLKDTPAAAAAQRLVTLFETASARGLPISVDFGEVRGFAYYTGMIFHAYAPGPGEAIGGGGRYDELLARFGAPMPAVGMGFDLDNLAWALRAAGITAAIEPRVLACGPLASQHASALRNAGIACAQHADAPGAVAYARSWGFSHVVGDRITDVTTNATFDIGPNVAAAIAALANKRGS